MSHGIRIQVGEQALAAELNDSETARAILEALPIECPGNRWGDEIYFSIPVKVEESPDARADMEVGELAYWAPGTAFCIFFGRTPASHDGQPRAASPVNPIGRALDDATQLRKSADGATVRIERA